MQCALQSTSPAAMPQDFWFFNKGLNLLCCIEPLSDSNGKGYQVVFILGDNMLQKQRCQSLLSFVYINDSTRKSIESIQTIRI